MTTVLPTLRASKPNGTGDPVTVEAAVAAARGALNARWSRLTGRERGELLSRVADIIGSRFDEFVDAEVADTGMSLAMARELDVMPTLLSFRASRGAGSGGSAPIGDDSAVQVGVVVVMMAPHLPLLQLARRVAPVLASGNTVVVNPTEGARSSARLLDDALRDAGLPRGVYSLVSEVDLVDAGERLAAHAGVEGVLYCWH